MKIVIDLQKMRSLADLSQVLSGLYDANYNSFEIQIIPNKYSELSHLVCIVAAIKKARAENRRVIVDCDTSSTYLQRINFFKEIGIDCYETFSRHNSEGRFLEISCMTPDSSVDSVTSIIKILRSNAFLAENILACLNYCFWEIVDNIHEHAESKIGGYAVAQYYRKIGCIEIVVVDTGCGIYQSLRKNPYLASISEKEAIESCIKQEYTSGNGRGNGLFQTAKFIRENRGMMSIYSGNYLLNINDGISEVIAVPYWQGTIIHIRLNANISVDLDEIFNGDTPTSVDEFSEMIDGLW